VREAHRLATARFAALQAACAEAGNRLVRAVAETRWRITTMFAGPAFTGKACSACGQIGLRVKHRFTCTCGRLAHNRRCDVEPCPALREPSRQTPMQTGRILQGSTMVSDNAVSDEKSPRHRDENPDLGGGGLRHCPVCSVAAGFVPGALAPAEADRLAHFGLEFDRAETASFMRSVAEGLAGAFSASTPPIGLAGLDLDAVRAGLRDIRGNCSDM
jgi:hypothetical protein